MKDEIWQRAEVESPCVKICVMHPGARICTGCFRTIEEIAQWSQLTTEERQSILNALPARAPELARRRGGRAERLRRRQSD